MSILIMAAEMYRMHRLEQAAANSAMRDIAEDVDERRWIRSNLSAEALEKFQATVLGIHRRFDDVMARRGK